MIRRRRGWVQALLALTLVAVPRAQEAAAISVRPSTARNPAAGSRFVFARGSFTITNATLHEMVRAAYDVQSYELAGGPPWTQSERFDVVANGSLADSSAATSRRVLQQLLADRFELRVRRETRDVPVFELLTALGDGRLGRLLRRSDLECDAAVAGRGPLDSSRIAGDPRCQPEAQMGLVSGSLELRARRMGTSMREFSRWLSMFARRPVLDRTGLAGTFDATVTFALDPAIFRSGREGTATPQGTSVFDAVRDQLGLWLEPATGPFELLVIDNAERP